MVFVIRYLRAITAIEMLENGDWYKPGSMLTDLFDCPVPPDSYEELIRMVTTDGAHCELAHIYAISAAIGSAIQSYMPPTTPSV